MKGKNAGYYCAPVTGMRIPSANHMPSVQLYGSTLLVPLAPNPIMITLHAFGIQYLS